jgi:hypothetical protein
MIFLLPEPKANLPRFLDGSLNLVEAGQVVGIPPIGVFINLNMDIGS